MALLGHYVNNSDFFTTDLSQIAPLHRHIV